MTKKKKDMNKKLYILITVIIVFPIILFLLFGNSKHGKNFVGIQAYKYKIGMDEYRYSVEKITSSKIAIDETYDVRCYKENCYFLRGYFANGNVFDSLAVIYDDNNYYLIDFAKKTREEIEVGQVRYVNFTDDGNNVLLFTSNNSFYSYNIAEGTLSREVHFDYIVYEDSFETINGKIFIYKDGNYRLVDLDTGKLDNELFKNVRKVKDYFILNIDGKDHIYSYKKKFKDLDITYDRIIDINKDYILTVDDNTLYLVSLNNKETIASLINNYDYDYVGMNNDSEFVNISLSGEKCVSVTYSITNNDVNVSDVECNSTSLSKNIYVSSKKDENIVITYGKDLKDSYDLTVTKNGFLYDIFGKYYDHVMIESKKKEINYESGFDIPKGNEYIFLKEKFDLLGLSNKIKNDYINLLMPIMLDNKENFIYFDVDIDNSDDDYKVLNNLDSYVSIDIYMTSNYHYLPVEELEKLDNSGFSVVVLSIN